ncbi:MAG: hypothetical protein LBQ79_02310, partial [Deltaproteobacteria bacterium]|nr:hypothetical protein [Deltaproteobacteria bacterium]
MPPRDDRPPGGQTGRGTQQGAGARGRETGRGGGGRGPVSRTGPGPRPAPRQDGGRFQGDSRLIQGGQKVHGRRQPQGPPPALAPCRRSVNVRLRAGGQIQAFDCGDMELELGDWVLVKVDDAVRLGVVATMPLVLPEEAGGRPVCLPRNRKLLRMADLGDLSRQAENELEEREARDFCMAAARRLGLSMKLVYVERTFDRFKTIFYYTAEDRVDFRQLVKDLVRRLRTRVEMRQISVRSEALMLGGNGLCGRPLCCASFLKDFYPVSVRMAKEQNVAINTLKISGVCGRLMCCLAFEGPGCGRCCGRPKDGDADPRGAGEGGDGEPGDAAGGEPPEPPVARGPQKFRDADVKPAPGKFRIEEDFRERGEKADPEGIRDPDGFPFRSETAEPPESGDPAESPEPDGPAGPGVAGDPSEAVSGAASEADAKEAPAAFPGSGGVSAGAGANPRENSGGDERGADSAERGVPADGPGGRGAARGEEG